MSTQDQALDVSTWSVSVVITTFNQARFLGEAISSVYAQTMLPDEIVVVDDGSTDRPDKVVTKFPQITMVRQANRGPSAARNAGLRFCRGRYIVFLDADDRLLPEAIQAGLEAHRANEGSAFVYGGHRRIDTYGRPLGPDQYLGQQDPFRDLLLGNQVAMHGSVMFDRALLDHYGGYDETLRLCEDYDVYLKLAREHTVASHPTTVAEYRMHSRNSSVDQTRMLEAALLVLKRHSVNLSAEQVLASLEGEKNWRDHYRSSVPSTAARLAASPAKEVKRRTKRLIKSALAGPARMIARKRRDRPVPVGKWQMGDFARTTPASIDFGYDRGTPIDRYFIERFLEVHRSDIKGCVLEVGDDTYSRRFGAGRVSRQEVLHIDRDNPSATLIGDMSDRDVLPTEHVDCAIITQTLQLVFDLPSAIANLKQSLRPGGVALVTVPGITPLERGRWGSMWYWSLTGVSALRLFSDVFGPAAVTVNVHGNVYAAVTVLEGLALSEVDSAKLDEFDPAFPVIITIRAVRLD